MVPIDKVQYIDMAPSQMVGVSAGLIPFLEHDDANRALMGSNMQRQAVPLLVTEPPIVATGMERDVATNSGMIVRARKKGTVTYVDATRIEIGGEVYNLRKFVGLNERTCQNQKPIVEIGQKVEKGDVIADGAATYQGELALGRNVLVGFMVWDGYNFEDAIIISEELVKDDTYTSIHIEEFDIEIRETKLGREEFTRDIPNVSEKALRNLDETGIVRIGTYVRPGDILVGKVSPKSEDRADAGREAAARHLRPGRRGREERLAGSPLGRGRHRHRHAEVLPPDEPVGGRAQGVREGAEGGRADGNRQDRRGLLGRWSSEMEGVLQRHLTDDDGNAAGPRPGAQVRRRAGRSASSSTRSTSAARSARPTSRRIYKSHWPAVEAAIDDRDRKLNSMKRGDELRSGVLQMVKVYVAAKRVISVGDKMAGRHGNKGVIAKILPQEDMPFLADGTPVQILLNPLGVPSRMNVGQILETHLGWAGAKLGFQAITPVFDGATEKTIHRLR